MNQPSGSRGFTLLEVAITLAILVTLIMSVASLMRTSFDVRQGLAQDSKITQRLNNAMQKLEYDLNHAFLLSKKETTRMGLRRRTVFKIDKSGNSDSLFMTYMGHQSIKANSKEGDTSYVVWEVKASEKFPHRANLFRGEFSRVPEDVYRMRDQPSMRLIAENIESIHLDAWRGDDWSKERWDSTTGDTDDTLPSMVRVTIRAWPDEPIEGVEPQSEEAVVQFSSIIYLPASFDFNELRTRTSSFRMTL